MSCFNCKKNNKQKQLRLLQEKVADLNEKISNLEKSLAKNKTKDLDKQPDLIFND